MNRIEGVVVTTLITKPDLRNASQGHFILKTLSPHKNLWCAQFLTPLIALKTIVKIRAPYNFTQTDDSGKSLISHTRTAAIKKRESLAIRHIEYIGVMEASPRPETQIHIESGSAPFSHINIFSIPASLLTWGDHSRRRCALLISATKIR